MLFLDATSNTGGLSVYVGDQPLTGRLVLSLEYGSFSISVQVFRGPSQYEYEPITINFESLCDGDTFSTSIDLTVSYIPTCARAEFHKNFRTFAVSSDAFVVSAFVHTQHHSASEPVQVNIYNPAWDFTAWSEYPNLQGIELLYRRVGDSEWRHALDADQVRVSFETIVPEVCSLLLDVAYAQDEIDYGFAGAQWNHVGLNDGEYELVLHVVCETAGLSFPSPGIDDYYSAPVRGVCCLSIALSDLLGDLSHYSCCDSVVPCAKQQRLPQRR